MERRWVRSLEENSALRRAFSIAELVIITAVIGILAALVMPYMQNQATTAKAAAAKEDLRLLRNTIELYATRHGNVAPGYKGNDPDRKPKEKYFRAQTIQQEGYLRKMPVNPFNHRDSILIVDNSQAFPSEATGEHGWIYQPATLTVRIDWPGTDGNGVPYFEY